MAKCTRVSLAGEVRNVNEYVCDTISSAPSNAPVGSIAFAFDTMNYYIIDFDGVWHTM